MKTYAINVIRGLDINDWFKTPSDFDFLLLNPVSVITQRDDYNGVAREKIYFKDALLIYPLVKIVTKDVLINEKPAIQKEFYFALHTAPLQTDESIEQLQQRFEFDETPYIPNPEYLVYKDLNDRENTDLFYNEMRKRVDNVLKYLYQKAYDFDTFLVSSGQQKVAVLALDTIFKKFAVEKSIWQEQAKGQPLIEALVSQSKTTSTTQENQLLKQFLNSPSQRAIEGTEPNEKVIEYLTKFIKNNYFTA